MPEFASCFSDYMEAVARKTPLEPPNGYGYKVFAELGVGCWVDDKTTCHVLEKPVVIPSGQNTVQGYMVMYAYGAQEAMVSVLEGQMPPALPATTKEPKEFASLEAIADNFGAKDPKASAPKSKFCIVFRVPAELATKADAPGRDIWMLRLGEDVVSPFLNAVREGDVEGIKKALATKNYPSDLFDEEGVSALMMAAQGGWEETCKALLSNKANPNSKDRHAGRTPLMFAAQGGHTKAIQVLLSAKADPAVQDNEGMTPLMWAAIAGHAEAAKTLKAVSKTDAVNQAGQTALQLAQAMKHEAAASVLA